MEDIRKHPLWMGAESHIKTSKLQVSLATDDYREAATEQLGTGPDHGVSHAELWDAKLELKAAIE